MNLQSKRKSYKTSFIFHSQARATLYIVELLYAKTFLFREKKRSCLTLSMSPCVCPPTETADAPLRKQLLFLYSFQLPENMQRPEINKYITCLDAESLGIRFKVRKNEWMCEYVAARMSVNID